MVLKYILVGCPWVFKYTVSNLPRQQMLLRRIAPERLWKHFPRVGIKTMTFTDYLIPLSTLLLHERWLTNSSLALWGCIYGHCWFLFFPEELLVKTSLSNNGRYLINHPLNNPSRFVKLFRIFGWDPWKTGNQRNCSTVYIDLLNKSIKNSLILHCIRLYSLFKAGDDYKLKSSALKRKKNILTP